MPVESVSFPCAVVQCSVFLPSDSNDAQATVHGVSRSVSAARAAPVAYAHDVA
jgi:hypothetical protein